MTDPRAREVARLIREIADDPRTIQEIIKSIDLAKVHESIHNGISPCPLCSAFIEKDELVAAGQRGRPPWRVP